MVSANSGSSTERGISSRKIHAKQFDPDAPNGILYWGGEIRATGQSFDKCPICNEVDGAVATVTADGNVTADLNPAIPTCTEADSPAGDDLCAKDGLGNYLYFSWVKTGSDPAQWKAIFDLGGNKLVIGDNVTVTVKTVGAPGGNNQKSPGIEIKGTCELVIEGDIDNNGKPGAVVVQSKNKQAGDILLQFDGHITIDGFVRNEVVGTNGKPGEITVASCCGDIITGPKSRIETIGVDPGGSDINILTCCERGYPDDGGVGQGGDIVINGLVRATHKTGTTPIINIVAFVGAVTIDGRNDFGEEVVFGTTYRRTSGVLVETVKATSAGDINIQALNNVTVFGNSILNKNRIQSGAVAIKSRNSNGQGGDGDMNVVSLAGGIRAADRAFDFENRFNALNAISLSAKNNITLGVTASINDGADNNTKAVVSSKGGSAGKGGTNTLLANTGQIIVGANAQVLANAPGGANGVNVLAGCLPPGVIRTGTVLPIDALGDDTSCPAGPGPLFESCEEDFGVLFEHEIK